MAAGNMAAGNASPGRPHLIAQLRRSPGNGQVRKLQVRKLEERNVRDRPMCHGPTARMQPASSTGRAAKQAAMRREQTASSTETRRLARGPLNPVSKRVSQNKRVSLSNRVGKI